MIRRAVTPLAVVTVLVLLLSGPATSQEPVEVVCQDGTTVSLEVQAGQSFQAAFAAACAGHMGEPGEDSGGNSAEPVDQAPQGHWEWVGYACDNGGICASELRCGDGSTKLTYVFVYPDGTRGGVQGFCPGDPAIPPAKDQPPTQGQIFKAFQSVAPAKATLAIQPPGGETLVNLDTIFSTEAESFSTGKLDLIPGYRIEFAISPRAFSWSFGDGRKLSTDWAGEPWVEGRDVGDLITHVYATKGRANSSVTIQWGATYRLNGGAPAPVAGTVEVTSAVVELDVLEAKPQLVR